MAKRLNGEGTIRERSDGRWTGQYVINGKRKSVYGKTAKEVQEKLNHIKYEIQSGVYISSDSITVGEWLNKWLYEYKQGNVKQKTFQGYETFVRFHLFPAFEKIKLKNLSTDHVQRLINTKLKEGLSGRTVRYMRSTLHNALNQAIQNGLLIRNVAEAVKISEKAQKERRILSPQEQQSLIQALEGERKGFMILLDLFTGLRCGELLGLRWGDVDIENKTITVRQNIQRLYGEDGKSHLIIDTPKTKNSIRTIPLLSEIVDKLQKHQTRQVQERLLAGQSWVDNNLVFCTEQGKPYDPRNLQTFLDRITDKINMSHVNTHALRHAFATRALEQGISLKAVSDILGHSSIKVTADIYSHTSLEYMENEMQKLRSII